MTQFTDHEGEELHPVHVLPYRIRSNEYGDYSYRKTHDEGELIAASLPELAEKLQALVLKYVSSWEVIFGKDNNAWSAENYDIPSLKRFRFGFDADGCYTNLAGKIAVAPSNGNKFVVLGHYRIELRPHPSRAPELSETSHGFEAILPAMRTELGVVLERSATNLIRHKEAVRVAKQERDRAELARLKAELGET